MPREGLFAIIYKNRDKRMNDYYLEQPGTYPPYGPNGWFRVNRATLNWSQVQEQLAQFADDTRRYGDGGWKHQVVRVA